MRSFSKLGLGAVTATAMATSTFPLIVVSVLASQLIEEFSISRAQVGFLITASGLVGALASPAFGHLTDRIGAIRSMVGTLAGGIVTLTLLAISPSYLLIVVAALLTGLPNGWGNPATNALIVDNVSAGARGVVTGIKQSGVQIGTFLGGLLLPLFAGLWGWRIAVLLFLAMPVGGLVAMWGRRDHGSRAELPPRNRTPLPPEVRLVALYGFVSGVATSAITGFLPLFAEEDQGWTESQAGSILAVVGLVGIFSRMLWPRLSERGIGHGRTLTLLSSLSTITGVLLGLAAMETLPSWVLLPAAVLLGLGAIAWNAVGMLAVMDFAPHESVGRGTGVVLFGFLLGLAAGAPLMGFSVDSLDSYVAGWFGTALLLALSGLIARKIPSRRAGSRTAAA